MVNVSQLRDVGRFKVLRCQFTTNIAMKNQACGNRRPPHVFLGAVSCCYFIFSLLIVTLISRYPMSVLRESKWSWIRSVSFLWLIIKFMTGYFPYRDSPQVLKYLSYSLPVYMNEFSPSIDIK